VLFQDEDFNKRPGYAGQKHNNGNGIDGMHYLKVKIGRPVRIFLPEKIHRTNIVSKAESEKVKAKSSRQKSFGLSA